MLEYIVGVGEVLQIFIHKYQKTSYDIIWSNHGYYYAYLWARWYKMLPTLLVFWHVSKSEWT